MAEPETVWHVQTGARGTVVNRTDDHVTVHFDGGQAAVELAASQLLHTDPEYQGVTSR
jgi:hypothetical protein